MPAPLRPTRIRLGVVLAVVSLAASVSAASTSAPAVAAAPAASVAGCSAVSAARVVQGRSGTDPNDLTRPEVVAAEKRVDAQLASVGLSKSGALPRLTIEVPIRYHVIVRDDGSGGPTAQQIAAQTAVLNQAYGGGTSGYDARTYFRFTTRSIDVTRSSDWFDWSVDGDTDDREAKTALHVGGKRDLNVYITGLSDGLLGYSNFPFERDPLWEDGVVVLTGSLPGGDVVPYNEGDTLTHEAGHWLGLLHTFENGCAAPGDQVPDTPYQADGDNVFFCDEADDTCPASGADPVHNFMSYGDDPCLDRFSKGQAVRMALVWFAFRSGLHFPKR